jgi:hypothetical protein
MFFNRLTAFVCGIVICTAAASQVKEPKIKFGDIKPEDFKPVFYDIDSAADAVYLYDVGSSLHEGNNTGSFSVKFKEHERIRLIHSKSFDDLATIKIPIFKHGNEVDKLEDLQAATYTLEDGKVVTTKVDKNSIFKDKDGDVQIVKFTFPNLKEGCIIEYSYTKTIPYFAYIPSWNFQGRYPRLWSEYTIEVPQFFDFVVLTEGYLTPAIDTASMSSNNFNVLDPSGVGATQTYSFRSNTIKHTWAYNNIPAIKEENYITDLSNYIQSLEFQLSAIRFPDSEPRFFLHTWVETTEQLMKDEDFGQELGKENGWLKDDVKVAVQGETDAISKAKKIYEYVRDNYSCTDYSAIYLSQPLKKTQQAKKGNVADINMLLIAMLRNADFTADPVLLSTRDHGKAYDVYPILSKFNYVIADLEIGDDFYLLDAANSILGFGHLSRNCYNGSARLIAPTPDIIDLSADSLHEAEVTSLFLTNDENGRISGTYKSVMGGMQSTSMREKMKTSNPEEYFKDVRKTFSFDVGMSHETIDSLRQPEMPVSVQYDISFKPEDDIIYFTPVLSTNVRRENPFSAAQRFYPVEMPYCMDETYILNMEVPAGYKVDELPKPSKVTLNENEGMFEYLIQQSGNRIQLRCRTKLNKATFEPGDYETLRSFFAFVVQKESEQIVFKKN